MDYTISSIADLFGALPRPVLAAALLMAISAGPGFSEDAQHSDPLHLAFKCDEVAESASAYFKEHGVVAFESTRFQGLSVQATQATRTPWTDAQGNKINDFKVYWTYANRNGPEKLPFFVWRLRLQHYSLLGAMRLTSDEGGCNVDLHLGFQTSGGNVALILLVGDSSWGYSSNGRMEREYLGGIATELDQRKAGMPQPPE